MSAATPSTVVPGVLVREIANAAAETTRVAETIKWV
jgi:hypothetical protein